MSSFFTDIKDSIPQIDFECRLTWNTTNIEEIYLKAKSTGRFGKTEDC
jgi:hypothetical protein